MSKYDVKTGDYDAGWNIIDHAFNIGNKQTVIRDNDTGEEVKGVGSTEQESRDNAWDKVKDR